MEYVRKGKRAGRLEYVRVKCMVRKMWRLFCCGHHLEGLAKNWHENV